MSWQRSRGTLPLGPLRIACVQPARKSLFAVSGLSMSKSKIKRRTIRLIVPTLRVVTHRLTLCVDLDAERLAMHSNAERGNDHA